MQGEKSPSARMKSPTSFLALKEIVAWGGYIAWGGLGLGLLIGIIRAWAAVGKDETFSALEVLRVSINQSVAVVVAAWLLYLLAFVPVRLLTRGTGRWAHAAGIALLTLGLLALVKSELDSLTYLSLGSSWNLINGLGGMVLGVITLSSVSLWTGVWEWLILWNGRKGIRVLVGGAALLNLVVYCQQTLFAQDEVAASNQRTLEEPIGAGDGPAQERVPEPEHNGQPTVYQFTDQLSKALVTEGGPSTSKTNLAIDFGEKGTVWSPIGGEQVTLSAEEGVLRLSGGKKSSGVESPTGFKMQAAEVAGIELRLKVDRGQNFELKWKRATDRNFGVYRKLTVGISQLDQFEVYRIKTERLRDWSGLIDGLRIYPSDSDGATAEIDYLRFLTEADYFAEKSVGVDTYELDSQLRHALFVHAPSTVKYKIVVPREAVLRWGMGIADPHTPVEFEITLETNGETKTLYRHRMTERRWADARLDMTPWQGQEAVLTFRTSAVTPGGLGFWSNPILYQQESSRPNVVIYLIDCLRADHMGTYGYERATTPFLDRFAAEGALFLNAYTQQTWTRPSVASLFSSNYSLAHQVNTMGKVLPESFVTLAEVLSAQGYATGHFADNEQAGRSTGLIQGFEHVSANGLTGSPHFHRIDFSAVVPLLRERAEQQRPFFLYIHTLELHTPYAPPPPYDTRYDPEYRGLTWVNPQIALDSEVRAHKNSRRIRQRELEHLKALYDGLINLADDKFQTFVSLLRDSGVYDNTLLIVIADHGEAFGERGRLEHGFAPYQELSRVPLLMRFPKQISPGQVIRDNVQLIDLAPTVLDSIGLPIHEDFQGRSLVPLLTGQRANWQNTAVYAEGKEGRMLVALIEGGWKLITSVPEEPRNQAQGVRGWLHTVISLFRDSLGAADELYDLENDPRERYNLTASYPTRVRAYKAQVQQWVMEQQTIANHHATTSAQRIDVDPHALEQLRGLGYVQ
jgi:arylsulfatase A-like enzyme